MIHIEKLTLLYINCNIWTATRKIDLIQLKAPDFPRELASPGSIKTLNPEELGVFKQIRHKIDSMCKKYGSRFCGNWIIPNEKLDLVTAELDRFKGEFAEAKRIFVSRYTELCRTWIEQHPEYADIIRQLQIEQKGIEKRFYFDYITYQIGMETLQNLNKALDMVVGSELRHAAADLKTIMVDSIFGADSIGSRVLHRVERICERLDDFRNLDPRVGCVPDF